MLQRPFLPIARIAPVTLSILVLSLLGDKYVAGEGPLITESNRPEKIASDQFDHAVPLNSSALLLDRRLLENGPELVRRIAKLGDRRLMIVVSMQCRLSSTLKPFEFGLMTDRRNSWKDLRNFQPLNEQLLEEYQQLLAATFAEAAKHKMAISVMLHLDPAGAINEWRNLYDFDPCEPIVTKSGPSYSYETAIVDSVIVAINKSVPAGSSVQFSLAGEMGRSVFAYPSSYESISHRVRKQLADYRLELGVSLNHNDLAGGIITSNALRAEADHLFASLDFIGYSHYRPFALPIRTMQFNEVKEDFLKSLTALGVTVPPDMPLHLSEVAIGGAPNKRGVAFTDWAAAEPWEGTSNPRHNPWKLKPMVEFRREYHGALLGFLSQPSSANPVAAAYLWSEGSWDPMGVSSSYFADPVIQNRVKVHNAR